MIDQSSLVHTEDVIIILKFGRKFMLENVGMFRVGRSWTISYTARDKAGNKAKCDFTFKLSGKYTVILACLLNIVDQNNEFSLLKTFQYTIPFLEAYNWFFAGLPIQKIRKRTLTFFPFSELLRN